MLKYINNNLIEFIAIRDTIILVTMIYIAGKKIRKARQIKNFKQDQKINKELFDLALEFAS